MTITIKNPWKNPHYGSGRDFTVYSEPKFSYKDHHIYKLCEKNYLYTYNGIAFSQLAGYNEKHLVDVANGTGFSCMYCRALERYALNNNEVTP
jgi:hypothetical protein